jgi:hypothetical protein
MSDNVLLMLHEKISGHGFLSFGEMKQVRLEIDRLRAEVERLKDIEQLYRELGEEVEAARPGVVITNEQIDKAWANRHGRCETRRGGYYGSVVTLDAEDLGIVECPECDGSGVFTHSDDVVSVSQSCPRCHGHKWIREERGDE